ncbi:MAG TPA: HAD-IIA family hydrolase [Acidimicrobiales bacterium]|nr:HAD-IIA family hydrolase [Acidimicrobiales bacterium]
MGWALDLDGVVWLGDQPIAGAARAVARLREAGDDVVFVTNNSSVPVGEVEAKLARHGIPAEGAVVTSAMAAATLLEPGERAVVCAGPGVVEELGARGVEVVEHGPADVVVVGFTRALTYDLLARAALAVRGGARLVATNDDATYPTPEGEVPGGGAILAAVVTATGVRPAIAGKPHPAMAELVRRRMGPSGVMVGDRPDTDGRFARALGYRFALVLSGVTHTEHLPVDPEPDVVAADLAALVERHLAASS